MTVLYELLNLDQWMNIMHQAQWEFHTHIMMKSNIYSTIHQYLTCPHWASTMARSRHGTLATNHRMRASVTVCHSLPTAARSSVSFLGNGFIQLRHLDIYNSMILIPGFFAGHRRTSIAALARNSWLTLAAYMKVKPHPAWRHLYLPIHDCQCVVQHEAWGCHQ